MKKLFLSIIAVCLGFSFWTSSVAALEPGDIVMSVTPSEQELDLAAGKKSSGSVTVLNVGKLGFKLTASVSPYRVSNDDYTPDYSTETASTRLSNWIKLAQDEYYLEPGEKVVVKFDITVPEGITGGGQYAAIMLQADSEVEYDSIVKVNGRVAAILYGHIAGIDVRAEGELVEHSLPGFMFNKDFAISQTVRNTGNVDFKVAQKLTVTNFFTNEDVITPDSIADTGEYLGYNISTVLPGTARTGILTWRRAPRLGVFRVMQEISFLDQEYEYSQIVLICPTWLVVIVLALIIAFVIVMIIRVKRSKQASEPSNLL